MTRLRELVDRANALWAPQERPFTSSAPLVGPVIVSVRRAWNWMSAKWYVRPILEQQTAFNSAVVQVINEMCQALEALDGRGQRVEEGLTQIRGQIEESAQQTRDRLEQMGEAQFRRLSDLEASLSNQIREAEGLTISNDRANTALARELARLSHGLRGVGGDPRGELSALREAVLHKVKEALAASTPAGEEDANSIL